MVKKRLNYTALYQLYILYPWSNFHISQTIPFKLGTKSLKII